MIYDEELGDWSMRELFSTGVSEGMDRWRVLSSILYDVSRSCVELGMSGRSLRKLPALANARLELVPDDDDCASHDMEMWLVAMRGLVIEQSEEALLME